jgi:ElaB/YqjD/DUF883 family membrane-anchored ribosome-binding protein
MEEQMASNGQQHAPMSEQLAKLQSAIDEAGKEGGEKAVAIADKGRQILSLARELASDIAGVTRETVSARASRAYRKIHDEAQYDVELARETVREHPLLAVAGVAAISALVAACVTSALSRRYH